MHALANTTSNNWMHCVHSLTYDLIILSCLLSLWAPSPALPGVESSWIHRGCRLFMSGHPSDQFCHLHLHTVPRHAGRQVLQSWTLLHHLGWHLPGLHLPLHSHRPSHHSLMLPAAPPRGALGLHVLLCSHHQDQPHRSNSGRQQEENMHTQTTLHECLGANGDHIHPHQHATDFRGHTDHLGASGAR